MYEVKLKLQIESYMMFFFNSNGSYQQEELALQIALLIIVDSTNRGSLSQSLSLSPGLTRCVAL